MIVRANIEIKLFYAKLRSQRFARSRFARELIYLRGGEKEDAEGLVVRVVIVGGTAFARGRLYMVQPSSSVVAAGSTSRLVISGDCMYTRDVGGSGLLRFVKDVHPRTP